MDKTVLDPKDEAQARLNAVAPKPGRYRHYKGGLAHGTTCVRTVTEWNEEVDVNGKRVKRFTSI